LWNEHDPILKERLYGLTNSEGNYGEDVKEYYFYLDSTPTHSYMKFLYKYPQWEFPYRDLIETNRRRSREEFEYELLDTLVFDDDRYFDVFVEHAKEDPQDVLIRITVHNRGPEAARLHFLPTLWFRNTWSWGEDDRKPSLREAAPGMIQASHHELGEYWLHCEGNGELLFSENESNARRLWGQSNASPYVKDAFHSYVIAGLVGAVNPAKVRTKSAVQHVLDVPGGGNKTVRLRLRICTPFTAMSSGSMSDRWRTLHDAVRGGTGNRPPVDGNVPARCQWAAAGVRRDSQIPGRSLLARPDSVLRVVPR
jgi:hypothetical protein